MRSDPLRLLGSDVTRDWSEGNELMFVFARTPYLGFWRSLCDRAFGFLLLARPSPSPHAWWGFGQGPAHFVTVAPSEVFCNWRGRGDVARLGGSSDVLYELTNRDVWMESDPVCFATGSAKPSGGVLLLLDLPSNRFPHNGDSMGSARGWIELEG